MQQAPATISSTEFAVAITSEVTSDGVLIFA
jgi:hypothetical protein